MVRLARFERATYPLKGRTPFAKPKIINNYFRRRKNETRIKINRANGGALPVQVETTHRCYSL